MGVGIALQGRPIVAQPPMPELLDLTDALATESEPDHMDKVQQIRVEARKRREQLAQKVEMADEVITRVENTVQPGN